MYTMHSMFIRAQTVAVATCCHPSDTYYIIGSTVGPHPYPDMVARLQSVISEEIKKQLQEKEGRDYPDYLIACVGGGSNAAGTIYHYIDDERVRIVLAEAGGKGIETGMTAATIQLGKMGIIHGARTFVIQNEDGQIEEPYSISAGLDYPGIGPMHANLADKKRAMVLAVNDDEAIRAAYELTRLEGIIPALESAHALGALEKITFKPEDVVVLTVSGRGDKDIETYLGIFHHRLHRLTQIFKLSFVEYQKKLSVKLVLLCGESKIKLKRNEIMNAFNYTTHSKQVLGDLHTPVSIYLKVRDMYPQSALMESSDYHAGENSLSFIALCPLASIGINSGIVTTTYPDNTRREEPLSQSFRVENALNRFINRFHVEGDDKKFCGLYGYTTFNAVKYFEHIPVKESHDERMLLPTYYTYYISMSSSSITLRMNSLW